MNAYRISWFIDVEAEDPLAAAREALAMQRDPESIATIFTVQDCGGSVCVDADTGEELPSDYPARALDDSSAIADIHALLDGEEWSTETIEHVAELVRRTGRVIREPYSGKYDEI
jgi:hypothetical protein